MTRASDSLQDQPSSSATPAKHLPAGREQGGWTGIAGDEAFDWGALVAREVHPLKVAIVELIARTGEPTSSAQITAAFELRYPATTIRYYLAKLEKQQILKFVEQVPRRGAREKLYSIHPDALAGTVGLTLSAAERDAVYEHLLDRLSDIESVWGAIRDEDFDTAERLGQEYSDELRVVLQDLGWGELSESQVTLTSPPDVLYRVFSRMNISVAALMSEQAEERAEAWRSEHEAGLVSGACRRVLACLEGPK